MLEIKKIMVKKLRRVTFIVVVILVFLSVIIQFGTEKRRIKEQSETFFDLMEQIILENNHEALNIEEEIRKRQSAATEIVSYILQLNPEKKEDSLWLKDIALLVGADEILFFDEKGILTGGTDHTYQGTSFADGEQLAFFKPMLKNKYLKLSQELTPRDFDGKEYRYSAMWSKDKTFIIQTGISARKYEQITERFDLSYLLSLLKSNTKRIFHVIQRENNIITASTAKSDIGKSIEEIGYNPRMIGDTSAFYTTMYHQKYFSVCHAIGNQYLIYHCPVDELYDDLLPKAVELGILLAVIAYIIIFVVVKYVDNLVIKNIQLINKNLSDISQGNLETRIDIRNSFEFKELSSYINNMVISLQEKAKKKEEIFAIVSQHSNKILYRYELKERTTHPWDAENAKKDVLSHLYENQYCETQVINNQYIFPESYEDVKQFFTNIHQGIPSGEAKIHLKLADGQACWYHFKYTSLFEKNVPQTSLITIEDITEQHEYELAYSRQVQSLNTDIKDHILVIESDLTEDKIEHLRGKFIKSDLTDKELNHKQLMEYITDHIFIIENINDCVNFTDIEALNKFHENGQHHFVGEIKVILREQKNCWFRVTIELIEDPYNGHLKAFTHLMDVTKEKEEEELIRKRAEIDVMTGLLRKDVGAQKIKEIFNKKYDHGAILITLDLDDLKGINDNLGHNEGDKAIIGIANTMKQHFRKDDILIRNGGDEFIVFLPQAAKSVEAVEQSMASLLRKLSEIHIGEKGERTIHCSGGCAIEIEGEDNFESLFKKADRALYHVKRNGKNNFAFYEPEMEKEDYEFRTKKLMELTNKKQLEQKELVQMVEMIMKIYQLVVLFNLSSNTYTLLKVDEAKRLEKMPKKGVLEDFIKQASTYVEEQELPLYFKTLNKDYLLKKFHEGSESLNFNIRVKGKYSSQLRKTSILFYKDENGDECAFHMLSK